MEFIQYLFSSWYVLPAFFFVLGIVVFVHEYGHYIVGRWCGIHAEVFSIGFGKELLSWVDKRGTRWRIGLLPLGGYVKYLGDADAASKPDQAQLAAMDQDTRDRSFHGAAVWKRMLSVVAGPVFNFMLSIVVFSGLALWEGRYVDEPVLGNVVSLKNYDIGLQSGDRILAANGTSVESLRDVFRIADEMPEPGPMDIRVQRGDDDIVVTTPFLRVPLISRVAPRSAALDAGVKPGDLILKVDDQPIQEFDQLVATVQAAEGRALDLQVLRDGQTLNFEMTPQVTAIQLPDGGFEERAMIGVVIGRVLEPAIVTPGPVQAVETGILATWRVISGSISGIVHMFSGAISATNIQGPLGIAMVSGDMAAEGFDSLINLMAVISTAIGLINLFPIPILDGGQLVFLSIEGLRGRPLGERWVEFASAFGLALVLLLMLFATYNDVMRL